MEAASALSLKGEIPMTISVLEAVRQGCWDFEPQEVRGEQFDCTQALPGSTEKLQVMVERMQSGLPLWHPADPSSRSNAGDE